MGRSDSPLSQKAMRIDDKLEYMSAKQQRVDNWPEVVEWQVSEYGYELLNLNRDQMLLGRNSDGEPFTPTYTSDPYFKTAAQANSYAAMKFGLELVHRSRLTFPLNYPDKGKDTPNLIVLGNFQDGMLIKSNAESFTIDSGYDESRDIEHKYNNKVFGLTPLAKEFWWDHRLRNAIQRYINFINDYGV